jgi:hypothetical protein
VGFHQGDLRFAGERGAPNQNQKEMYMLQPPSTQRFQIVGALTRIRREWQDAAGTLSLIEVEGNMAMLLADLINGLGLGTNEQVLVLGQELFQELKDFLKSPIQN